MADRERDRLTDGGELMTAYGPNGEEITVTRKAFRQVYRGKGFAETRGQAKVTADTPAPAAATARKPTGTPTRGAARKALAGK